MQGSEIAGVSTKSDKNSLLGLRNLARAAQVSGAGGLCGVTAWPLLQLIWPLHQSDSDNLRFWPWRRLGHSEPGGRPRYGLYCNLSEKRIY